MTEEVIAMLMPEEKRKNGSREGVQALGRKEDGEVTLRDVKDTGIYRSEDIARFRQAVAIRDPETREVIGYEMEAEPAKS
jgi:hypothetical protein